MAGRISTVMSLLLLLIVAASCTHRVKHAAADHQVVGRFGIVTDVHYADAATAGTRHYNDSLAKMKQATAAITEAKAQFLIELGDFKDTNPQKNVNDTLSFLEAIERGLGSFTGPKFHVLGNHDVDILNQSQVLSRVKDWGQSSNHKGYYSFDDLIPYTQADSVGCLVHDKTSSTNVWLVHNDSTRNWIAKPTPGCFEASLNVPDINAYTKRYGATDPRYSLNASQSELACKQPSNKCSAVPAASVSSGLHYVVLNGDFNAQGEAWYDVADQTTKFNWEQPWVDSVQMEWLEEDLRQAKARGQKAVIFIHYRLDGGPGMNKSAWVDDCTLKNAGVLRAVLEGSGIVLATFSGHDHAPVPGYTLHNGIFYFTHKAMVEGSFPASNAFSTVEVMSDCSIRVVGHGNATSANHTGAPGCSIRGAPLPTALP